MPWLRVGPPGSDTVAILCGKNVTQGCLMPRLPEDTAGNASRCYRMTVALCDAPGCDKPICERHRTKHRTKPNTDFCPEHQDLAMEVNA
jgi:hypothetical protein